MAGKFSPRSVAVICTCSASNLALFLLPRPSPLSRCLSPRPLHIGLDFLLPRTSLSLLPFPPPADRPTSGALAAWVSAPCCGDHLSDLLFIPAAQILSARRFLVLHSVRVTCVYASLNRRRPLRTKHINVSINIPQLQPLPCLGESSDLSMHRHPSCHHWP